MALGEHGGQAGLGGRQALPASLPVLCLRPALPPSQPMQKSLLCCWVFSPLLIPNQEIKGRQRLRLFPLCRELESSGRGDRPFPDRPRGGGHAPQVEGPGWGEHPGSGGGGSQRHSWDEGTLGVKGGPCWGGPGSQGSSKRVGGYLQQRRRKAEEDGLAGSPAAWRFPC